MANTRFIKLTKNGYTYLPVTLASGVQYSYTGGVMSVQEAIETVASAELNNGTRMVVANNSTSNSTVSASTNNPYINMIAPNDTVKSSYQISGSTSSSATQATVTVNAANGGKITISATYTNTDTKVTSADNHYSPSGTAYSLSPSGTSSLTHDSSFVITGLSYSVDTKGHITSLTATKGKLPVDNDTKVTSAANHYKGTITTAGSYISNANGATAAWSIDVIKGFTLSYDAAGHITGLTYTSGKIPANPVDNSFVKTSTTTTQLTTNAIVLGNSNDRKVKSSTYYPQTSATAFNSDSDTQIPTSKSIAEYISTQIGDLTGALNYKGTVGTGGTVTALPGTHNVGDVYIVSADGTYAGKTCQVGDMIIANSKNTATGNETDNTHWTVVPINFSVSQGTSNATIKADGTSGTTEIATIDGKTVSLSYAHGTVSTNGTASGNKNITNASTGQQTVITGLTYSNGHITGYTTASIYSTDTDTKVTSADNHYTPTGTATNAVLDANSVTASTTSTNLTHGSSVVLTGVKFKKDAKGHITELSYSLGKLPEDNDTKVTSAANHYTPSGTSYSLSPSGTSSLTHNSSFVITGLSYSVDTKGHITSLTATKGKLPEDTHLSSYNIIGASNTASADATVAETTNAVYLNHLENNSTTPKSTHKIVGSGQTKVSFNKNTKTLTINTPAISVTPEKNLEVYVYPNDVDDFTLPLGTATKLTDIVTNISQS